MAIDETPHFETIRINSAPRVYRCEAAWNWAPPPLADHDLWCVISGHGTLAVRGETHSLAPGCCFVLRPGDRPRGLQDAHDRLTVFFAHFDVLDGAGDIAPPLHIPVLKAARDSAFLVSSAHRIERLWQRGDELARFQSARLLELLIWQIWDETQFPAAPANKAFEALTSAIRGEPGRNWSLDEMAREVHLSRAQFTRRFRVMFGTSPTRFVIEARLERARPLLIETEMTLEQIAHALGYGDVYFFARQFKQFTGQTPGAVRRSKF